MYKSGDFAYMIESNRKVRAGRIVQARENMYLFAFSEGGGLWIRENRLFPTEKDAEKSLQKRVIPLSEEKRSSRFLNHLAAIIA